MNNAFSFGRLAVVLVSRTFAVVLAKLVAASQVHVLRGPLAKVEILLIRGSTAKWGSYVRA